MHDSSGLLANVSGRMASLARIAISVSENSNHPDHSHGAILFRGGGNIIARAANSVGYSQFGAQFRLDGENASRHAEIAAITGLPKEVTSGASVLVIRITRSGVLGLSKPCDMCVACMRTAGIKRVFFSTNSGTIEEMKL